MSSLWQLTCSGGSMVYKIRRKLLSQNFLYSRTLIRYLVRRSSICQNDTVLEIGPGKGFITTELVDTAKKVIAVEIDPKLALHLSLFLKEKPNLEIYNTNFLDFPLPDYSYKVFANISFSIGGEIVRKLFDGKNPPEDYYLIIDRRLALRLSGIPFDNQFSLKHKSWFEFSIFHHFKRSDFIPIPNVESVMWHASKKNTPLIPVANKESWEKFIEIGFGQGTPVYQNLRKVLSKVQFIQLQSKLNFSLKTKPSYLSFNQWLQIFNLFQRLFVL